MGQKAQIRRPHAITDDARAGTLERRGRGALSNTAGRYENELRERFDDGWDSLAREEEKRRTEVTLEKPKHIITRNASPDVPFERSINAYRGCEHGCIYCFARPSHAWHGLSPGLDFETKLFAKPDAPAMLRRALASPRYKPRPIAMGTNTDPYQPIEKTYRITRGILEVMLETGHPCSLLTKSDMILRDMDLLKALARRKLVRVAISVTTLDRKLARTMEPRATTPARRLRAVETLNAAGIPAGVMFAPVIPALNDHEMEQVLDRAQHTGARTAGIVMLRLPNELSGLFREWLAEHYPARAGRVMHHVQAMRGGRDNDSRFGHRMRGAGAYADIVHARFRRACKRLGLNREDRSAGLSLHHFRPPQVEQSGQMELFCPPSHKCEQ